MTYNGKPFDPDDFSNDILKAIMDLTKNHFEKKLKDIICPIHSQHLETVKIDYNGNESITFKLKGCCDELVKIADESLKNE